MNAGTALAILKLLLSLAVFFARRAEKREIEGNLTNAIQDLQAARADRAVDARDDVLSGRLPPDKDDPNRRD